jgi:hypothetical protein
MKIVNTSLFYIIYLVGITSSILSYNIVFDKQDDPIKTFYTIPEAFSNIGDISTFSTYLFSILAVYGTIIAFLISSFLSISIILINRFMSKKKYIFNINTKRWEYTNEIKDDSRFFQENLSHSNIEIIRPVEFKEVKLTPLTSNVKSFREQLTNKISVFYFVSNKSMNNFDNLIINIKENLELSSVEIIPYVVIYNDYYNILKSEDTVKLSQSDKIYIAKQDYKGIKVFHTNIYNPTKIKNCILTAYQKVVKNPEHTYNVRLASVNENLSNYFFSEFLYAKTEFITFLYDLPLIDHTTFSNAINTCVSDGCSFVVARNIIRPSIPSIVKIPTTEDLSKTSYVPWYKRLFYNMESIEYDVNYLGHSPSELIRGFLFYLPPYTIWRLYDLLDLRFKDIESNNCNIITENDVNSEYKNRYVNFYDELDMIYQGILAGMKSSYDQNSRFYTISSQGLKDWIIKHYACCCIWIHIFKSYFISIINCCSKVSLKDKILYILSFIYFEILYYISSQALPIIGLSIYYQLFNSNINMLLLIILSYSTLPIQLLVLYFMNMVDPELKRVKSYHSNKSIFSYILYSMLFPFYNQLQFLIIVASHVRMVINYTK